MFKFGFGQDIGIDLGTATVIAYVKGKGQGRPDYGYADLLHG